MLYRWQPLAVQDWQQADWAVQLQQARSRAKLVHATARTDLVVRQEQKTPGYKKASSTQVRVYVWGGRGSYLYDERETFKCMLMWITCVGRD